MRAHVRVRGAVLGAALAAAAAGAGDALAQSKVGTTTAQFLRIEPSARTAAMGNAGAALAGGIDGIYFNPGAIGAIEGPTFQFTHAFWFADIAYDYAAAALPLPKWGTVFASLTSLGSGEIDVRTVERPLGTGERFTTSDLALGLGYGLRLSDRFSAGIQANYVRQRIWHTTQTVFTFNLGTLYRVGTNGFTIGSAISNLGTTGRYEGRDLAVLYDADSDVFGDNGALPAFQWTDDFPVPLSFVVGLSYPVYTDARSRVLLLADATHPNDNAERVNLGAEWSFRETLSLRAGWQTLFQDESELGPTLGVGLRGALSETAFRFDYGWADHDRLEETHRVSLALEL